MEGQQVIKTPGHEEKTEPTHVRDGVWGQLVMVVSEQEGSLRSFVKFRSTAEGGALKRPL